MSLNWDISKIADHDELFVGEGDERKLDGITESFIWMSMVTGLGKNWTLDDEFAPEFYARYTLLNKLDGPLVTKQGKPVTVTFEDVQRRIGLKVNCSPVTRSQFLKNAVAVDLDRWASDAKRKQQVPA